MIIRTAARWYARNFQETLDLRGKIYLAKGERVHISQLHIHVFRSTLDMCTLEIDHGGFDTLFF